MSDTRLQEFFDDWSNAQDRLEEVLAVPSAQLEELQASLPLPLGQAIRDVALLRFVFVYDLSWHTMQRLLYLRGVEETHPRPVLQHAFRAHWIDDEPLWMRMVTDRNLVAHTYKEATAIEIYDRVKNQHAPILRKTYDFLRQEFTELLG